jgi:hypothetical protein
MVYAVGAGHLAQQSVARTLAQASRAHSNRPSTTTCDRPPTHTVPSASIATSSRASWPISRPWLTV